LGIAGSGKLVVGGDIHDGAGRDWNVSIAGSLAGTDLGALGIESNGDLAALLNPLGFAGIVDDRLYIKQLFSNRFLIAF